MLSERRTPWHPWKVLWRGAPLHGARPDSQRRPAILLVVWLAHSSVWRQAVAVYHHNSSPSCQLHHIKHLLQPSQDLAGSDPVTLQFRQLPLDPFRCMDPHQVICVEVSTFCVLVIGSLLPGPSSLSLLPCKPVCQIYSLS